MEEVSEELFLKWNDYNTEMVNSLQGLRETERVSLIFFLRDNILMEWHSLLSGD